MKSAIRSWKYLFVAVLSIGILSTALMPAPVSAAEPAEPADTTSCSNDSFLGFPAWYKGLTVVNGEDCDVVAPSVVGGLSSFVWIIVLNVVEMILRASGYAAVAFIIYGGYKYMISAGSPDGMVAARKTILNAVVGLVISIAAVAIVNTVSSGLGVGR